MCRGAMGMNQSEKNSGEPTRPRNRVRVSRPRRILGLVLAILALYILYLVQTEKIAYFEITGTSMEPTLPVGTRLVMYQPERYDVGDVIVFFEPGNNTVHITKRIVAKGPVRVELRQGEIFVNGRRNDPPQGAVWPLPRSEEQWFLNSGEYFVVGDNRSDSFDSRDYGPIPEEQIQGKLRIDPLLERREVEWAN